MLLWKDSIKLCSLGAQPIYGRILKRPSLLRVERLGKGDVQGHLFSALLLRLVEGEDRVYC